MKILVALACISALLAGCGGADEPSKAASPAAASPSFGEPNNRLVPPTRDAVVPLQGDERLRMRWAFQSTQDEYSLLTQRAIVMWLFPENWSVWTPKRSYRAAVSQVLTSAKVFHFNDPDDKPMKGRVNFLVGPRQKVDGDTLVQVCMDERGLEGIHKLRKPGPTVLVTIKDTPNGPRVSDVDQTFHLDSVEGGMEFFRLCQDWDPR